MVGIPTLFAKEATFYLYLRYMDPTEHEILPNIVHVGPFLHGFGMHAISVVFQSNHPQQI